MSQYGVIYRLSWLPVEEETTVTVNIYDTEILIDDGDTPTVFNLKPSGSPLVVSTVNNDQKKTGIRSKQARIEFLSSNAVSAYTFADAKDFRFYVEAVTDTYVIFKGFLVLDEITRPLMPNPNVIQLTASDNLGLLKERKLLTDSDENPSGKNRIADYIAWCLRRTGLEMPINVVNNVRPGTGSFTTNAVFSVSGSFISVPTTYINNFYEGQVLTVSGTSLNNTTFTVTGVTLFLATLVGVTGTIANETAAAATFTDTNTGHLYDVCYLDAKTFEAEIGESEDCYSVLEKILDKDSQLFQYRGQWWIVRPDEMDGTTYYIQRYLSDGSLADTLTSTAYEKEIGNGLDVRFVNAAQLVEYKRPYKFQKHTFRHDLPQEIPCNIDFSRGTLIATVSAQQKHYAPDCWDRLFANTSTDDPNITGSCYVRKLFNGEYETDRFLVFEADSRNTFVMSEPIQVEQKDKFTIGIQHRLSEDPSGTGFFRLNTMQVRLYGDDGTYWTCNFPNSAVDEHKWYQCTSTFRTFQKYAYIEGDNSADLTQSISLYNGDGAEIPVKGYIRILIYRNGVWGDTVATYYSGVTFEYIPYINGAYQKFAGQSSKVERSDTGYSANNDETVSISDAPKPILKGGIFKNNSGTYTLQPTFWNAAPFALGQPTDTTYFQPYEKIRVYAMYNQYRRGIRILTGQVKVNVADWPDLVHQFTLPDADFDTNDRLFMLVGFEQDFKSGIANITLMECYHSDGKVLDDPFEFKYITE